MKQHQFNSYEDYLKTQRMLTLKKVAKPDSKAFIDQRVVDWIKAHHPTHVAHGCCHGVRRGEELTLFEHAFPKSCWVGTEITAELCDGQRVIHHDFGRFHPDFLYKFNLIYSNSFDHALDPEIAAKMWLLQLENNFSYLYVEWTPWHAKLGIRGNKADCFGASVEEYIDLFERKAGVLGSVGVIEDADRKGSPYKRYILQFANKLWM